MITSMLFKFLLKMLGRQCLPCLPPQAITALLYYLFSVLPPVLVPRHSEFAPGHSLLSFPSQVPEPMPNNVSYTQNGFVHSQIGGSPQLNGNSPGSSLMSGISTQPSSPICSSVSPGTSSPHSPYGSIPGKLLVVNLHFLTLFSFFLLLYFYIFSKSIFLVENDLGIDFLYLIKKINANIEIESGVRLEVCKNLSIISLTKA